MYRLNRDIAKRKLRIQAVIRLALPVGLGHFDLSSVAGPKLGGEAAGTWYKACVAAVAPYGESTR